MSSLRLMTLVSRLKVVARCHHLTLTLVPRVFTLISITISPVSSIIPILINLLAESSLLSSSILRSRNAHKVAKTCPIIFKVRHALCLVYLANKALIFPRNLSTFIILFALLSWAFLRATAQAPSIATFLSLILSL